MVVGKHFWHVFVLFSIILVSGLVFATPGIPHQFNGTVLVNGSPAPNGTLVKAVVSDSVTPNAFTTATVDGKFGEIPAEIFFVTDPNGNRGGKTVSFFVDDVATNISIAFKNGDLNTFNFSITKSTPPQPPENNTGGNTGGGTGGGGGGGGGGGSGGTETNLLKLDKTVAVIGEDVTASARCLWSFGCSLKVNGVEIKSFNDSLAWQDYTTSFDSIGDKVFTLDRRGTGDTLIGSKTLSVIKDVNAIAGEGEQAAAGGQDNNAQGAQGPENTTASTVFCSELNCDDKNPCTTDTCNEGVCSFVPLANKTPCGTAGVCENGSCVESAQTRVNPVALFGLGGNAGLGLLLLILAIIITIIGVWYSSKRKSKQPQTQAPVEKKKEVLPQKKGKKQKESK